MTDRWLDIEAEARAQVSATLQAEEAVPLEPGAFVAWSTTRLHRTDDFSLLHRVGVAVGGKERTTCDLVIPELVRRMPLSPALVATMRKCRACEAEAERLFHERAA